MSQESSVVLQALSLQMKQVESRLEKVESLVGLARSVASPVASPVAPPETTPIAPSPPVVMPPGVTASLEALPFPKAAPFPAVSEWAPPEKTRLPLPPVETAAKAPEPVRGEPPRSTESEAAPSGLAGWNDWEQLIGGRWALWLGALCLFLSAAFFLAYTWKALSPAMHVALGATLSGVLIGVGAWSRERTQRWFSEGLFGTGLSIGFLSAWAAGPYYGLLGFSASFALLAGVAGLGVVLALRYDARSLSILSALGGYFTPVLLHTGHGVNAPWSFLTYLAILNATLLFTSVSRNWPELRWLCGCATLLLLTGWTLGPLIIAGNAVRVGIWVYWTLYWLLFLAASSWNTLARDEEPSIEDMMMVYASTSAYAAVSWFWLRPALGAYPALFPLGLTLWFALVAAALGRWRPRAKELHTLATGCALLAFTLSFPSQYATRGLSLFWTLEAGALLILASRLRSQLFLFAGQAVLATSLLALYWDVLIVLAPTPRILFVNARALPLLVWTVVVALVAWERQKSELQDDGKAFYPSFAALAGAYLLCQETGLWFSWTHYPSVQTYVGAALMTIAMVGFAYSLGLWRLARRIGDNPLLDIALVLGCIALILPLSIAASSQTTPWTPFFNLRALAFALGTGMLFLTHGLASRDEQKPGGIEASFAPALPLTGALYGLAGISLEVYFAFAHDVATAALALAMLWSAASVLFLAWPRPQDHDTSRVAALGLGVVALTALLVGNAAPGAPEIPLFNLRCLAIGFVGAAALWGARHLMHEDVPDQNLATSLLFVAWGLMLWVMTRETALAGFYFRDALGPQWERWAQLGVSLVWSLVGTLTLIGGVVRQSQPFRLAALAFLAATSAKVFLFDFAFLDGQLRVLSFGGLGLSLIFISWLYSRFVTPPTPPKATL